MTNSKYNSTPLKILIFETNPKLLLQFEQALLGSGLKVNVLAVDSLRKLDDITSFKGLEVVIVNRTMTQQVVSAIQEQLESPGQLIVMEIPWDVVESIDNNSGDNIIRQLTELAQIAA